MVCVPSIPPVSLTAMTRPNILVVVPDDFGMDAWTVYASRYNVTSYDSTLGNIRTPNLDALVQAGVKFTRAYSQPWCSPTRAAFMTGRYGFKTGVADLVQGGTQPLLDNEVCLPKALKQATSYAYACGAFGKWHLSNNNSMGGAASHPITAGFDEFYGIEGNPAPEDGYYAFEGWHAKKTYYGMDLTLEQVDMYAPLWTVQKCTEWIQRQTKPWFAYVPLNLPHGPMHKPPTYMYDSEKYVLPDIYQDESGSFASTALREANCRLYFSAMVQATDYLFGVLLNGIPQEQRANTVVILWSDNGTDKSNVAEGLNGLKSKYTVYDLGTNVPMVVAGPKVSTPGRSSDALVAPADLFSTVIEIAGGNSALVSSPPSGTGVAGGGSRNSQSFWAVCTTPATTTVRTSLLIDKFSPNKPNLYATVTGTRAVVVRYNNAYYKLVRFSQVGVAGFTAMTETSPGVWAAVTPTNSDAFFDLGADPFEDTNKLATGQTMTTTQKDAYLQAVSLYASLQGAW